MNNNLQIDLLADHPEAIPILTAWFEREWTPYYGPEGPGDAESDLRQFCNQTELPIAFVAILDGEICGTAALKQESVTTHPHLSPWLAALLVTPEFRRQGIAERLIEAIEKKAKELGFHTIYVGTGEGSGTPESALRKRDWEFMEKRPYFVSDVSIFRKTL
ncbi:MAG: GNAT family N-acetyltransferase [Sneathiellales bacterium]|nr:GNAT family N-acetyltransferase [Sneathiellales bacterium]